MRRRSGLPPEAAGGTDGRFPPQLMHAAAELYYLKDATQADIAERLGTSRATVSRLLSEARRTGIVRIEVVPPSEASAAFDLADEVAAATGLERVYLAASSASRLVGAPLAPALSRALLDVGLQAGDVLLVSSGRTVYEASQADLPALPGVLLAPTVGGQDEPEVWYQTNEITRRVAAKVGGRPSFLYAPALPGPDLHRTLLAEPSIRRVIELWQVARCAVLGVGAPPLTRESIAAFVPTDALSLREAVGDVCSRFYDRAGDPVDFPGVERLLATGLDVLQRIPVSIGVATGAEKALGLAAAARAGYINRLVTDTDTARALLGLADPPPARPRRSMPVRRAR